MCATRALESYDRRRHFQYQLLPIAQVPLGGPDQTLSETRWIRAGLRHVRRLSGRVRLVEFGHIKTALVSRGGRRNYFHPTDSSVKSALARKRSLLPADGRTDSLHN